MSKALEAALKVTRLATEAFKESKPHLEDLDGMFWALCSWKYTKAETALEPVNLEVQTEGDKDAALEQIYQDRGFYSSGIWESEASLFAYKVRNDSPVVRWRGW